MTDKQPEALELASVAESADLAGYPTARKANAYYLCLLSDCSQMIRRLHAENETLRAGYAAARLEIESLNAQLAAEPPAPRGTPVAWLSPWRADQVTTDYDAYGERGIPLYTAPQPSPAAQGGEK